MKIKLDALFVRPFGEVVEATVCALGCTMCSDFVVRQLHPNEVKIQNSAAAQDPTVRKIVFHRSDRISTDSVKSLL